MTRDLVLLAALATAACTAEDDADTSPMQTGTTSSSNGGSGSDEHQSHGSGESADPDDGVGESTAGPADDTTGGAPSDSSGDDTAATTTGPAIDTWENWALPAFFDAYCNQCHPAGGQSQRDFSDYDQVGVNIKHIRCGVAPEVVEGCESTPIEPGHLPIGPGPYPDDDERFRLVDWIDAGMPRD